MTSIAVNYRNCLMRRYLYGYKVIDQEYDKMISEIVNKIREYRDNNLVIKQIISDIGEYSIITKMAYDDVLIKYLNKRFHKKTTVESLQEFKDKYYTNGRSTITRHY